MSKIDTPELTPEVLERLQHYAQLFREDFRHQAQATYSGIYLQGLLHDGERKSIEPLSRRVSGAWLLAGRLLKGILVIVNEPPVSLRTIHRSTYPSKYE